MSECKCGQAGCAVRQARGLRAWCDPEWIAIERAKPSRSELDAREGIFTSYEAAIEASPVRRAKWISGGGTTGSPARFRAIDFVRAS